jgi:tetratricopeptide (TPR) repeat protein
MSDLLPARTPEQRRTAAELYQIADQWLVAGRPDKAVTILQNCCRLDPQSMIYRQGLRTAQRQLRPARGLIASLRKWRAVRRLQGATAAKDWLMVLALAEEVLTLNSGDCRAHLALAKAYESMGLLDHAIWCLEQAPAGNHGTDNIAVELRRLYERTGRFSLAQGLKEIPLPPSPVMEAPDWPARDLAQLNTFLQDAGIAEQRLCADPKNKELQTILARLRHEIQAREIEICRQKADLHPGDRSCLLDLGIILLKAGQFEAALEAFQTCRADDHMAWRAILYAAYCHLNMGQWRQAKPLFEEALNLIPAESEATRKEVLQVLAQNPVAKPAANRTTGA